VADSGAARSCRRRAYSIRHTSSRDGATPSSRSSRALYSCRRTGWSIRKFVRTARRYRTIHIRAGHHTLTAEDPLPPDLRDALALIK
jgi:hypothetical protein